MAESLKFGTSGLRGLARDLEGAAARRYCAAFLAHLRRRRQQGQGQVLIARDLRASSPAISADCAVAVRASGLQPVDCGVLPTPALALHAMALGCPAIMVTGSHIPPERNGLKFYTPQGEIGKEDELGILGALVDATAAEGAAVALDGYAAAGDRYRQRYRHFLRPDELSGWRIGVFEHSSVARDLLCSLLTRAGCEVVRLGRSAEFIAVDTEALADPVFRHRQSWIAAHQLDGIVSTDGDGDRPLLIDASGEFFRGDVLGILCARFIGAETVVTPVTSNSAIESVGWFGRVQRTRVGSPYVIAGMAEEATGGATVVGFEANGGVLLGSDLQLEGRVLTKLPTRDAVLPLLAVLAAARRAGQSLAQLAASVPLRPALSDRLENVDPEQSAALVGRLSSDTDYARDYFASIGQVAEVSTIDGPRFTLQSGDVIHYRPSGNAPELRCYVEGSTPEAAGRLLHWGLEAAGRALTRVGAISA
ncbi:MAG TPA: phosphomannomutase [Devosiaceae bacterium]|jgi:phosphomannomutase|nr:phosphomannomutase [Devosiaceae bacterium]